MSNLTHRILLGEFDGSSSDDDEITMVQMIMARQYQKFQRRRQQGGHVGSTSGRAWIPRDRVAADQRLNDDYFCEYPLYDEKLFQQRFRMSRPLFHKILGKLQEHDVTFVQRNDATGAVGLSGIQKMTAALRMMAYGTPADSLDEYLKIGGSTAVESLQSFCRGVISIFEAEYLRKPNEADTARLLHVGNQRRFPGMLGNLDCMHWQWDKCPTAYHGFFSGRSGKPTIVLEAVASYDLWIWHAFFGMPGSFNDINVLDQSHLFDYLSAGRAPPAHFIVNGSQYDMGYYLADGIYPKWATLVQTISQPQGRKKQHFARMQEACRKDVERAFGVLQARWAIVRGPARFWNEEDLGYIMKTCVILHNMIIEDQRDHDASDEITELLSSNPIQVSRDITPALVDFFKNNRRIRSNEAHHSLRNDLIEHLWARNGDEE
ncbi:protein ALP1-like [Rhododendron vialii]|uniref:protein ALP1-like n=1 Tax=Rhododendron vialii TaxID=182163 RepID=UPI00265FF81A|nr:protein ALP1-like [Rhododendron vialii]